MKKQNNLPCIAIVLVFVDETQGWTVGACSEKGVRLHLPPSHLNFSNGIMVKSYL